MMKKLLATTILAAIAAVSLFSAGFVYSDRRGRWSPLAKGKRNIEMKKLVVVAMAAAALSAAAMPTEAEFAKASKDVQAALKAQITSWQKGELADGDLAALMLMNADKFKDEARHYACLQAAFAAAVLAGDAVLAANAIEKIAADTKDFGAAEERRLAIARRIARLHGGDVVLSPVVPSGARFVLSVRGGRSDQDGR